MNVPGRTASRETSGSRTPQSPAGARGVAGLAITVVAGAMLLFSFTELTWFEVPMPEGGTASIPFSELGDLYRRQYSWLTSSYFEWFGVTAAMLGFLLSLASCVPLPLSVRTRRLLKLIGASFAAAAAGLTFLAVPVTGYWGYSEWFGYASGGFTCTVAGFALCAVAALLAPRSWSDDV